MEKRKTILSPHFHMADRLKPFRKKFWTTDPKTARNQEKALKKVLFSCWSNYCTSTLLLIISTIFNLQLAQAQSVTVNKAPIYRIQGANGWVIHTKSAIYQIAVNKDDKVKQVYFGPSADSGKSVKKSAWIQDGPNEVPVRGGFPGKTPVLEAIFPDYVRDIDLQFSEGEIINTEGRPTLRITQNDTYYPLEVNSFYRVLPEFDIIEKWIRIKNTGNNGTIKIENLESGSIKLPANQYRLTHLAGAWGHEFQLRHTNLTTGVKTLQSKNFKSVSNPPWFMVQPQNIHSDTTGNTWFGTLAYSGNYRIGFNQAFNGPLQITGGINFWDTHWMLKPGTHFQTPTFIIGFTQKGAEGVAHRLHAYIRQTVLPEAHQNKVRPVLYNSWYATHFDVNQKDQLELARIAQKIGVELFVIDDGWFKGRKSDNAGLGDWTVDQDKFPNGLSPFIKKVHDMGMDFGLWVEPEMVNPNSDLYRKHPKWAFHFLHRKSHQMRNQLMLNLAREDVYHYLLNSLSQLLKKYDISFLKWDHNRTLSEPGWPAAPAEMQREVRIRYINNLYRLIDELRRRFPDVSIEDCSSGGGRVDLGLLSRTDQAWTSDNTDPVDRLFIQYGYLSAFPANSMVSWTTNTDRHKIDPSLSYRFDVSMSGVLGVGNDISTWDDYQIEMAQKKINQYKRIRKVVQNGISYRLVSPFKTNRSAIQYVNDDQSSSVLFCYNMAEYLEGSKTNVEEGSFVKFRDLDPNQNYQLKQLDEKIYSGDYLMKIGIPWPIKGAYNSLVLEIHKVENVES